MRFTLFITILLVSLLVGLAIETSAQQLPQGGHIVVPCDAAAYVIDKDPNGLNVRSGPGKSYAVIGNLGVEEGTEEVALDMWLEDRL
ncbi:MAG TPA: hypothetical protein VJM50_16450 [Pyrinomonadaceae bacterium]|nr:hypothetical protein [Pyrinomonadaceae bacterium]